jgi:hypothetical protein
VIVFFAIFAGSCSSNEPKKVEIDQRYERVKNVFLTKGSQTTDSSWYYEPRGNTHGTFYLKDRKIIIFFFDKDNDYTIFLDSFKTMARYWYTDKNGDGEASTNVSITKIDSILENFK